MRESDDNRVKASDLFLYLVGNRGAIERIASSPWIVAVAALLVLTAGIARNYDHLDLLRREEWFVGPFGASLLTTLFVWVWVWNGLRLVSVGRGWPQLLVFLNLVWLTAPCAWIYGIPVERFCDPVAATKWNITFLAIVSAWRVAVVVRALIILTKAPGLKVFLLVLVPTSLEMTVASYFKHLSIIGVMGGVRLAPHEQVLRQATAMTGNIASWTFVLSAILAVVLPSVSAPRSLVRSPLTCVRGSAWMSAFLSLLAWGIFAMPYHRPIANRDHLAALVEKEEIGEAVKFATSLALEDFSSDHYLPPDPSRQMWQWVAPKVFLDLIDALPPEGPAWLREEWTANAIIASQSFSNDSDGTYFKALQKSHPTIYEAVKQYADELSKRTDLSRAEKTWLFQFQDQQENIKPE